MPRARPAGSDDEGDPLPDFRTALVQAFVANANANKTPAEMLLAVAQVNPSAARRLAADLTANRDRAPVAASIVGRTQMFTGTSGPDPDRSPRGCAYLHVREIDRVFQRWVA